MTSLQTNRILSTNMYSKVPKDAKPILKWAGGKTQMLDVLLPKIPKKYNKYIEPFFGGGAFFYAVNPDEAVIADSNPELVNLYRSVANNLHDVIFFLSQHHNDKDYYYEIRSLDWKQLSAPEAAARTIFLNKTCFNGLYRVNKSGGFNVPFGNYKNPKICDIINLTAASEQLKKSIIVEGDYKKILKEYAEPGDLIFLDPPYLPISEYSDFQRYTKEQFYEEDHVDLAQEVKRLSDLGCHVILTNSNHPLVHELYDYYNIEVHQTKRYINKDSSKRTGEDVVVTAHPKKYIFGSECPLSINKQAEKYPPTRYMGSKSKLLPHIKEVISQFDCKTVLDLFSGSGVVSYMLKAEGKEVISNDYMAMGATFTKAMIENNDVTLSPIKAKQLLQPNEHNDYFVQNTFKDIYYNDEDNQLIDTIRANIKLLTNPYEKAIATSALIRACVKKRPRGIFTYTGDRYDDGRKDLLLSLEEQFLNAVSVINEAVFSNNQHNKSRRGDAMDIRVKPDLVYMDPPYYSPHSDNEYVRRYHFVEGIACDWQGVEMQWHTKTKKFKSYPTPFSSRVGASDAFDKLFKKFKDSIIVVSYSSNSLPTLDEMVSLMSKYKQHVEVISINHKYSFGNQSHKINDNNNDVLEYLFVGF